MDTRKSVYLYKMPGVKKYIYVVENLYGLKVS
jgi:hypothetical protein